MQELKQNSHVDIIFNTSKLSDEQLEWCIIEKFDNILPSSEIVLVDELGKKTDH